MNDEIKNLKDINLEKENQVRTLMDKLTKINEEYKQQKIELNMLQTK